MNKNKILIGCAAALALTILLAGVAGYVIYRRFAPLFSLPETPEELKQPAVILGSDRFDKRLFIRLKHIGRINSIAYGEFDPAPGPELCIVGQTGAVFTDQYGDTKGSVAFAGPVETLLGMKIETSAYRIGLIQAVDVDRDQSCEFLVRQNFKNAELLDHQGARLWAYNEADNDDSFLDDLNAGDVDGDHRTEYAAAYLHGKGLVLLNDKLQEIWSKPDVHANVVEFVDTDNSGRQKIVHDDHGRIVLRDADGNVISEGETGHYIGHFSLVRWPSKKDRAYALHFADGFIRLFDFDGKTVKRFQAPLSEHMYRVHATAVKLKAGEPEYFAAVAEFSALDRSVLYVYDPAGNLIYQEVLPEAYQAIAAVPVDQTGQEAILLGGGSEVLEYRMNTPAGKQSN